ncbi:MAG: hypothetical protein PHO66_04695 [Eubacteriales bacterium]|nr:hypothetical protein [Eubacteriales bacterium]
MKRVFGTVEAVFDVAYLAAVVLLGLALLAGAAGNTARLLAGAMALVLAGGDACHLAPRILVIKTGNEERFRRALGRGKQVASITMTVYYLLLWQIGLLVFAPENIKGWSYTVYLLAAVRIVLCLLRQNKWEQRHPPLLWGLWRNLPFFLQGVVVAGLYFLQRNTAPQLAMMWPAIAVSFAFYLPVVLWVAKNPKIGMLMLPKSCAYVWMVAICLSL